MLCPSDNVAKLRLVDLAIDGAGCHQLAMVAHGCDPTAVEDDDLVGTQDAADALGYNDDRTPGPEWV
jgi:hypothetical protein